MALKRLGAILFSHVCPFILAVALALPPELYSAVTPDREIVPVDAPDVPLWKNYWDAGRELARQGNFASAAEYYEKLLRRKPQIEEAKWEYCKVLYKIEKFTEASTLLESLIEVNPYQIEYLALAGYVALETGEYGRAVNYLGQVYSQKPEGQEGVKALTGLIRGLMGLGKKAYAFILMEQLHQRVPNDRSLLRDIARNAYALGFTDKAVSSYSTLISEHDVGEDVLIEAAEMFASTGNEEKAVPVWKLLLQTDPENRNYHQHLFAYYRKIGASREALPHLLRLLERDGYAEPDLLLEAGRIYVYEMARADKALRYYERYLQLQPHDDIAAQELDAARERIASELLAIVENDGAELLWKDLREFTDNRLALFQLMAEKLERSGKILPLIQVLEIIYLNSGDGQESIALKIAELSTTVQDYAHAYDFMLKIKSQRYRTYSYYSKKADLEIRLGYDVAALDSRMQALAMRPGQLDLRGKCIRLAGQLGFLKELKDLGEPLTSSPLSSEKYDLYLRYLEGLRLNGQYAAAESLYSRLLDKAWLNTHFRQQVLLHKAETLKTMGLRFQSQKLLRKMLVAGQARQEVILRLIESAIDSGATEDGWALFEYYIREFGSFDWKTSDDEKSNRLFQVYIGLLSEEGDYSTAVEELELYTKHRWSWKNKAAGVPPDFLSAAELELCRLYLRTGEKDKCRSIVARDKTPEFHELPEVSPLRNILFGDGTVEPAHLTAAIPAVNEGKGGVGALFALADQAAFFGNEKAALTVVSRILELHPQSMRAKVEKAAFLKKSGLFAEASGLYRELWRENNIETVYYQEYLMLEFKQGHYPLVISELRNENFQELPIELKLLQARTLWAMNEHGQAFRFYREMLSPSVSTRFQQRLAEKDLDFTLQERQKQAFWDIFSYDQPDQLERLNAFQGEDGFLSMSNTPVKEIVADLYDSYRWEKLINKEYQVRKAVEENRYIVAEKQYRQNHEKEDSTESLKDLARIYERLGDYSKEAEVYSYLEKQGEKLPELQESIERNKIARAPTLAMNYSYLEKKGRDDLINLQKSSAGLSFKYLPGLNSSLKMEFEELSYDPATGSDGGLDGRQFSGNGRYEFNDKTSMELGLGFHMLDSEGDTTPLFDFRIDRQLDELLSGYVQYKQEIIDDTLEALEQSLDTGSIIGGLVLEGTTGVNIGGEYQRLWYDDDNTQDRIFFWASYSIFSELSTFELKYSYELLNNRESDTLEDPSGPQTGNGNTPAEEATLPYWSPGEYWQHLFSLRFQHLLRDLGTSDKPPSYYSLDFSLGYESEENITYSGSFDIFLEMSSNILLKGELFYSDSRDYDEQKAAISIMYRW